MILAPLIIIKPAPKKLRKRKRLNHCFEVLSYQLKPAEKNFIIIVTHYQREVDSMGWWRELDIKKAIKRYYYLTDGISLQAQIPYIQDVKII